MSTHNIARATVVFALAGSLVAAHAGETPGLGKPIAPADLARIDRNIYPDGRNLPEGSGTARDGKPLYAAHCARCHGPDGRGLTAEELIGREPALTSAEPAKTIGTYWPYATTLFDMIRRSMPLDAPGSLADPEAYALTAYLLAANGIVADDAVIDRTTLPAVRMPNRDGFDRIDAK